MRSSRLREAIVAAVAALPPGTIEALADTLEAVAAAPKDGARVLASVALPHERTVVRDLLRAWQSEEDPPSALQVAAALRGATWARAEFDRTRQVELVWTGPSTRIAYRRTEQALLQVVHTAQRELVLVTFAAYRVPLIVEALREAIGRGVTVHFVGETNEESGGRLTSDSARAFAALGSAVRFYTWPREKRPTDVAGNTGSLHAKCALADSNCLFVSSANLTDHALSLNIEMGVLIRGGPQPVQMQTHFQQLLDSGHLRQVPSASPM